MFVDTNVLVSARAVDNPYHDVAVGLLERAFLGQEPLRISRQIIREYLAVVTRPQTWLTALTPDEALDDVSRMLRDFEILEDGQVVTDRLLALLREVAGGRFTTPTLSLLCLPTGRVSY